MKFILILIVCIVFSSGHYFISDSFAQGIEKSLGASIGELTATLGTAFIMLIIPVSIAFVIILKMVKKLTSSRIKKYFAGAGLLFLGLLIVSVASNSFLSDEEKSAQEAGRIADEEAKEKARIANEEAEEKARIAAQKQAERDAYQQRLKDNQIQRQADKPFVEVKRELDSYLRALEKGILECNSIPNSVKISSLVKEDAEGIVVNAVLMYLVIEEIEKSGYSGLSSYKNRIATTVDRLTECLNRH